MKLVWVPLLFLLFVSCAPATPTEPPATETPTIPSWQATNTAVMAALASISATPKSTVTVTPLITFKYDASTNAEQRALIEQALALAQRYYGPVDRINVYTSPETLLLCKDYLLLVGRTQCPNVEGFIAYAVPDGGIFVLTSSEGWRLTSNPLKMHTVIHEYVHLVQFYLAYPKPPHYGVDTGPLWLYEGSADLLAARALESEHLYDFKSYAFSALVGTRRVSAPLIQLETKEGARVAGLGSEYSLGFKAVEYLERDHGGRAAILYYFERLNTGSGWRGAFDDAFGISPREFYEQFEDYRRDNFPPLK